MVLPAPGKLDGVTGFDEREGPEIDLALNRA
jgi:hypothetical protein